jgi:hypothetical protein
MVSSQNVKDHCDKCCNQSCVNHHVPEIIPGLGVKDGYMVRSLRPLPEFPPTVDPPDVDKQQGQQN